MSIIAAASASPLPDRLFRMTSIPFSAIVLSNSEFSGFSKSISVRLISPKNGALKCAAHPLGTCVGK